MVFDYLRSGLGSNPFRFAEQFDVHYPLVAIGRWPPMYYAVQAIYYFLAGPSIRSAQILSALMAACLALLVYLSLKSYAGVRIALIATGVFLATPLMQATAWEVMSDLLTGLFVYLAILAFAQLLDQPGHWKAAVAFIACAIAAVLTKGSAWALAPFFILAPVLARRNRFFRSRWFLGAVLAVVLLGSVFYLLAARFGIGYPMHLARYLTANSGDRQWILSGVLGFAPVSLIGLGLLGASVELNARWRYADDSRSTTLSLVATAWIASQFIFLLLLPMTPEPRVLLPSLAPLAVLAGRFLYWLQGALRQTPVFAATVPAILAAIVVVNSIQSGLYRVDGLRQTADAMPYPPDGALILVAAWGCEEGMITERLSHNPAHRDVILRGSQILVNTDEAGNEQPLFQSAEATRDYLLQMPVRFVVLRSPAYQYPFQSFIDSAVTGDPQDFHLIATVPIAVRPGGRNLGELRVYENPAGRDRHPSIVEARMGSTGRIIQYHWK
jgi:4-amino-4-deoxy-L-arabinose transferase-like glycosyltransferase